DKIMYFTHLGDSRIYCLHEGELNQLTRDHTLIEEDPLMEVKFHDPHLIHALTAGLGIHEKPAIEVKKYLLQQKDLILMTTEGLTNLISNREILRLSLKTKNLEKLCCRLIDLADRKGGDSYMTVGIMRIGNLSKELRNLLIAYSALFVLIISVMGGYYLKYNERGSKFDHLGGTRKIQPRSGGQKKTVVTYEIKKPTANHLIAVTPIKEEAEHQEEEEPDDHIFDFINNWKTAWENTAGKNNDMNSYMSFYSDDFVSKGLDKNGWKNDKADKGNRKRWIRVELMDIRISKLIEDNQIEVRFFQSYRSTNYSGKSDKILILKKEEAGWKIISENETE
ncbi:MAG: hypothetical protein SV375_16210, partial [Thermodesulfobacteriota bacterium]|nr:hypothetical protein [Thermodesulfobacteriota bacterium]